MRTFVTLAWLMAGSSLASDPHTSPQYGAADAGPGATSPDPTANRTAINHTLNFFIWAAPQALR
ncbi:hypothetical protein NicSoilB4_05850 [Arthrobacter sp. NicSoilB4]|nr:hypothetical protein NicSoilB4_05850 [Arthrobacter sp. NicSoilB4]